MKIDWKSFWNSFRVVDPYNPRFITHLNYIKCFRELSENIEIKTNRFDKWNREKSKKLDKKVILIRLIKKSLDKEYKECKKNKDFAEVTSIWVPVKAYYLIFNMLLILYYLISPENNKNFNISHKALIKRLKESIKRSELIFNKPHFNHLYTYEEVREVKFEKGENLRKEQNIERLTKFLIKKLFEYKREEFQRANKIKDLRGKRDRNKVNKYMSKEFTNLIEFFYWYRIKANYRDLNFLKEDVGPEQFFNYFENYYFATINFYNALKKLINEVSQRRFKEVLIK